MLQTLVSERLIYKPLSLDHCSERYVDWLNDEDVYKYLETGGNYTVTDLQEFLNTVLKQNILFWAIHLKADDKHIGNIKIDPVNKRHGLGEYGIMMGDKAEWGKGYAKEASKTIIDHCFNDLKLRKITLGVVEKNTAALNLYKNLGFEIEGVYKNHGFYMNEFVHVIRMAIFNPHYEYK